MGRIYIVCESADECIVDERNLSRDDVHECFVEFDAI